MREGKTNRRQREGAREGETDKKTEGKRLRGRERER